ncbi:hypothetical protein RB2634 [Rhodopirellula baltica SH 1]|uniref:Uncharacterized protein n=1 Tax=Rhodopirellula baltica (strain DSM 10527 / NCIMB 13988 / SH1) TaxID=243090 RepID=Q7UVH4_RHOBA|nr:hypothetical protein RB2634 [Rhodopirellula baltica SH 1]
MEAARVRLIECDHVVPNEGPNRLLAKREPLCPSKIGARNAISRGLARRPSLGGSQRQ